MRRTSTKPRDADVNSALSSPREELPSQDSSTAGPSPTTQKTVAASDKRAIRREQCRTNQARYRQKQIRIKRQLQQQLQRLEEEIHGLKLRKRSIRFERKTNQSPWAIVGEVFRLVEDGFRSPWRLASLEEMMKHAETRQTLAFLQKAFVYDVAFGDLRGINALMDQWRRYSLYFEEPHLELKGVNVVAMNILCASATFSLTVTEFTLRCVFPHLVSVEEQSESEGFSLEKRLLGQRLDCSCLIRFFFDEVTGRVVRLEPTIDLASSLLRLLENLGDVADVLDHSLITPSSVVGDVPRYLLIFGSD